MSTIASNTTLCGPLSMPDIIPGANRSYSWCATPNVSNTTQQIMQYCCGSWNDVRGSDGCAFCYLSYPDVDMDNNTQVSTKFSDCISLKAREINATTQRITHCHTGRSSGATIMKVVSVWKVGVLAVLLGVAEWLL